MAILNTYLIVFRANHLLRSQPNRFVAEMTCLKGYISSKSHKPRISDS